MAATDAALTVNGLTKRYGTFLAVDGLSFSIGKGEIFALLGPNGAGKTTTIKMIAGLLAPDAGSVERGNSDPGRGAIGLCPQELVVWETLSCFEQLVFMARMHGVPGRRAKAKAKELLAALGLEEKKGRLAKTLSGGMLRRLNIALALVHEPSLVILDEPQAGLDPQSRVLVREYVRSLGSTASVLLTTHDMEEADKLADRVAIIDSGRLLVLDSPDRLKAADGGEEVVVVRKRTLEDVFIALTGKELRE